MNIPRVLIAGEKSGCGKTTVVCGLLKAFKNKGLKVSSFKCGPDYIDPLFHRQIVDVKSSNIDLFFTDEDTAKSLYAENAKGSDISVVEGVMGYYDGLGGISHEASSYHVASVIKSPVILVVDGKGASLSICAKINGFKTFRENSAIVGVILNRCSQSFFKIMAPLIEKECGVLAMGYLEDLPHLALKSRHLGLVTPEDTENMKSWVENVAKEIEETVNLDIILEAAAKSEELSFKSATITKVVKDSPIIGVPMDRAFCFYYNENLSLLEKLGAKTVFFSPLEDERLPHNLDGLYIGGGYPELYAKALAENISMRESIENAVKKGMPTIAECGGFMYLGEIIESFDGKESYEAVGAIKSRSFNEGRLKRFGYITLEAQKDNLLCSRGERINAHEFHYYEASDCGDSFEATKPLSGRSWNCIHGTDSIFAGFPHIYFYSNKSFAENFVKAASRFRSVRNEL